MDTEKNTTPETNETETTSFKTKREQWEAEWKAELKRDWEKSWKGEWKNEWKNEWKKHGNWKQHSGNNAAVKLEINNQTYSISLGKLIFGIILLTLLPFNFVLVGGAIWAAYHFGRRSAENDSTSDDGQKSKREEPTAA